MIKGNHGPWIRWSRSWGWGDEGYKGQSPVVSGTYHCNVVPLSLFLAVLVSQIFESRRRCDLTEFRCSIFQLWSGREGTRQRKLYFWFFPAVSNFGKLVLQEPTSCDLSALSGHFFTTSDFIMVQYSFFEAYLLLMHSADHATAEPMCIVRIVPRHSVPYRRSLVW